MTPSKKLTLNERVVAFKCFELPGQPISTHMGTSYLIGDLAKEITALTAERDIYQKATDDWHSAYVTLSAHYDALMAAGKLALSSMECNQYAVADMAPHADVMAFNAAIEALKQAGVEP